MASYNEMFRVYRTPQGRASLHFTPAEWRVLLEDRTFLKSDDNCFAPPRKLMGVPVEIVPDHGFG